MARTTAAKTVKQKILLTGFEPFGGEATNPSMQIANALQKEMCDDYTIHAAILPVERFRAVERSVELISEYQPDVVIALGVAAGRTAVTPEKVAINFDDYRIADNGGNQPIGEPIVAGGPAAYFSTLPINRMCQMMNKIDVPSAVSFSAGTFVCNHLMYGILEHIERNKLSIRAGFVHVPQAQEFAGTKDAPTLPLAMMVEAVRQCVCACCNGDEDIIKIGGNTH